MGEQRTSRPNNIVEHYFDILDQYPGRTRGILGTARESVPGIGHEVTLYRMDSCGQRIPVYTIIQPESKVMKGTALRRVPQKKPEWLQDPGNSLRQAMFYWAAHSNHQEASERRS